MLGHQGPGQGLCAVGKNEDFHGRGNSGGWHEHPVQQALATCRGGLGWAGLTAWWVSPDIPRSWGLFPSTATVPVAEMTTLELFLSMVTHCNYLEDPLCLHPSPTHPCTALQHPTHSAPPGSPSSHQSLLSHLVPHSSATSLSTSSAVTEIQWLCWCEIKSIFIPFSYFFKHAAFQ